MDEGVVETTVIKLFWKFRKKLKAEKLKLNLQKKPPAHSGFACVSFKYENDMPENAYKPKNLKL